MRNHLTLISITGFVLLSLSGCATTSNIENGGNNVVSKTTMNNSSAANGVTSSTTLNSTSSAGASTSNSTSNETTQSTTTSAGDQLSASLAAKMKNIAGIGHPTAFVQGFHQLQTDVAQGNKVKVAAFVSYPIKITIDGKTQTMANAQAFVQNYDVIMTSKIKTAIGRQQVNQFFVNVEGVMVGNGEVWFTQSGNANCTIYAINP